MSQKESNIEVTPIKPIASAGIRYSDLKQEGKYSLELQLSEIRNAVERNGHYLPEHLIFIDKHVSAYHKKAAQRPALNELKKTVKNNPDIEYIYFYDYSRLDRTIYSFVEEFYYDLKQYRHNIQIYLCTTGSIFDPEDPRTKLEFILASYESAKKAMTITDTQINLLNEKQRPGARSPFGYKMQQKTLFPDDENALVVVWIFFLYSWGYSMSKIAKILNTDNIPPPQGAMWRSNTVEQILTNPIYIGRLTWQFNSKSVQKFEFNAVDDPIVPPFLYSLVEVNKKLKNKMERLDTPFLLASLINCSICCSPLTTRNSSTKRNGKTYSYRYYQCHNCNYSIEADNIQSYIRTDLTTYLKNQFDNTEQKTRSFILECEESIQYALIKKEDDLKRIEFNRTLIEEKSERFSIELEQILQNATHFVKKEIKHLQLDLTNIQRLKKEEHLSFFLSQFTNLNLNTLTVSEQRFIFALFIEHVSVSDKGAYRLYFKEQPFDL